MLVHKLWIMKRAAHSGLDQGGDTMIAEGWRRGKKWKTGLRLTGCTGRPYTFSAFFYAGRWRRHEADVPTEPAPSVEGSWVSGTDEDGERAPRAAASSAQGQEADFGLGGGGRKAAQARSRAGGLRQGRAFFGPPPRTPRSGGRDGSAALRICSGQEAWKRRAAEPRAPATARSVPLRQRGVFDRMRSGAAGAARRARGDVSGTPDGSFAAHAQGRRGSASRAAIAVLTAGIRFYRRFISPLTMPHCRYTPTCSQYALVAIERYGARKGGLMAIKRLLRCHPFHPGGWDPVP